MVLRRPLFCAFQNVTAYLRRNGVGVLKPHIFDVITTLWPTDEKMKWFGPTKGYKVLFIICGVKHGYMVAGTDQKVCRYRPELTAAVKTVAQGPVFFLHWFIEHVLTSIKRICQEIFCLTFYRINYRKLISDFNTPVFPLRKRVTYNRRSMPEPRQNDQHKHTRRLRNQLIKRKLSALFYNKT